jgi:hypothetical protein
MVADKGDVGLLIWKDSLLYATLGALVNKMLSLSGTPRVRRVYKATTCGNSLVSVASRSVSPIKNATKPVAAAKVRRHLLLPSPNLTSHHNS